MYLDTITYLLRLFILGWALHKVLSDEMRRTVHKLVCPTRRPKNLSETHGTGNFNLKSYSLLFLMNAFYIAIADQPFTNRHSAITFWYVILHPFSGTPSKHHAYVIGLAEWDFVEEVEMHYTILFLALNQ